MDAAMKRWDEYSEGVKKGHGAILKKMHPEDAPKRIGDSGTGSHIQTELERREKLQEHMKSANKILKQAGVLGYWREGDPKFKDGHTAESTIVKLMELEGVDEAKAKEILTMDRSRSIGYPSFTLSNNNANIRRYRQQAIAQQKHEKQAEAVKQMTGGESSISHDFDGGKVHVDYADNRIRIAHDSKPDRETIAKLKRNGFRWSPANKSWQRQITSNARDAVSQITGIDARKLIPQAKTGNTESDETDRHSASLAERFAAFWAVDVEIDRYDSRARDMSFSWSPHPTKGGRKAWKNIVTGEVRYQEEQPGKPMKEVVKPASELSPKYNADIRRRMMKSQGQKPGARTAPPKQSPAAPKATVPTTAPNTESPKPAATPAAATPKMKAPPSPTGHNAWPTGKPKPEADSDLAMKKSQRQNGSGVRGGAIPASHSVKKLQAGQEIHLMADHAGHAKGTRAVFHGRSDKIKGSLKVTINGMTGHIPTSKLGIKARDIGLSSGKAKTDPLERGRAKAKDIHHIDKQDFVENKHGVLVRSQSNGKGFLYHGGKLYQLGAGEYRDGKLLTNGKKIRERIHRDAAKMHVSGGGNLSASNFGHYEHFQDQWKNEGKGKSGLNPIPVRAPGQQGGKLPGSVAGKQTSTVSPQPESAEPASPIQPGPNLQPEFKDAYARGLEKMKARRRRNSEEDEDVDAKHSSVFNQPASTSSSPSRPNSSTADPWAGHDKSQFQPKQPEAPVNASVKNAIKSRESDQADESNKLPHAILESFPTSHPQLLQNIMSDVKHHHETKKVEANRHNQAWDSLAKFSGMGADRRMQSARDLKKTLATGGDSQSKNGIGRFDETLDYARKSYPWIFSGHDSEHEGQLMQFLGDGKIQPGAVHSPEFISHFWDTRQPEYHDYVNSVHSGETKYEPWKPEDWYTPEAGKEEHGGGQFDDRTPFSGRQNALVERFSAIWCENSPIGELTPGHQSQ